MWCVMLVKEQETVCSDRRGAHKVAEKVSCGAVR